MMFAAPAIWLLFSVSFARANYAEQILKWKWILLLTFVLPLSLVTLFNFNEAFVSVILAPREASTLFIRIGWSGYYWHLLWIISAVLKSGGRLIANYPDKPRKLGWSPTQARGSSRQMM
jgi:hypothetical protein